MSSHALESSLLKYSAKEYYFRASLCHLCVDVLNAEHAIKKYGDLFPAFADSRECKFVKVSEFEKLALWDNYAFLWKLLF